MGNENEHVEESAAGFTCQICIEPTPFPVERSEIGDPCFHPFCTDCMVKHIAAKLELGDANIACPALNCNRMLDPLMWGPLVGPSIFRRWCDALCEDAIADWSFRYCPRADCGALIVNECGGTPRRSMCPNCRRWFCFQCVKVWHARLSCEEARDENDIALGNLAEKMNWKRCPRCRIFYEKTHGCSVIRCRCRVRICYGCGNPTNRCGCWRTATFEYRYVYPILIRIMVLANVAIAVYGVIIYCNRRR